MAVKTLRRLSVLCFLGLVLMFQTGCEDGDDGPSASDYGITNASMAALVVKDECAPFYIKDITINNTVSGQTQSLGGVSDGQQGVFEISPGNYGLTVRYYGGEVTLGFTRYWVDNTVSATFEVGAGDAAVYSLKGGASYLTTYRPPTLARD